MLATAVGYAGGHKPNPTYEEVCSKTTGHAETVLVEYDPTRVSYDKLLDLFWSIHDPTTPNRQGLNFGNQYRSVLFCHTPEQRRAAEESRDRLNASGRLRRPIVTEIIPAGAFWLAEEYHQQFSEKRGGAACLVGG